MKNWVKERRKIKGFSQAYLGELIGKNAQYISRVENYNADDHIKLSPIIAEQLAAHLETNAQYLLFGEVLNSGIVGTNSHRDFPILGIAQAGVWREEDDYNQDAPERFVMPHNEKYPAEKLYILNVLGSSMNRVAKDGDKILCINMEDIDEEVECGKYYIIENWRMDVVERTFKKARKTPQGFEFVPESDDPKFQEPIKLGRNKGEMIKLKARVIGIHREV